MIHFFFVSHVFIFHVEVIYDFPFGFIEIWNVVRDLVAICTEIL